MKLLIDNMNSVYVELSPFRAKFTDTSDVARLYVSINNDDLLSQCVFLYRLCDELRNNNNGGTITCIGDYYKNWDGNNEFPFTFVAENIPGGPLKILE